MKPLNKYFAVTRSNSETSDLNCREEKKNEAEKEVVRASKASSTSVAREKEMYEEEMITSMLEKSATTDIEKSVEFVQEKNTANTILETKIISGHRESREEKKSSSLWESLKERESKSIGNRKSGLDCVTTTERNDSKMNSSPKKCTIINDSNERGIAATDSAAKSLNSKSPMTKASAKINNPVKKKGQSVISDFFPRRVS